MANLSQQNQALLENYLPRKGGWEDYGKTHEAQAASVWISPRRASAVPPWPLVRSLRCQVSGGKQASLEEQAMADFKARWTGLETSRAMMSAGTKSQVWRVTKQVLREFLLPFLVALTWTFFRVSRSEPDFLANLIANFSASFFLASWATGQIYRIIYRHDVEDSFQELGRQLGAIRQTMEPLARVANTLLESPGADPAVVRALAAAILAANAQVTAASTAFLQTRRQMGAVLPWYD